MKNKSFNARSDARIAKDEPGLGDDIPCSKCGSALDTGLECTECGHDMRDEIYPKPSNKRLEQPTTLDTLKQGRDALNAALDAMAPMEKLFREVELKSPGSLPSVADCFVTVDDMRKSLYCADDIRKNGLLKNLEAEIARLESEPEAATFTPTMWQAL